MWFSYKLLATVIFVVIGLSMDDGGLEKVGETGKRPKNRIGSKAAALLLLLKKKQVRKAFF